MDMSHWFCLALFVPFLLCATTLAADVPPLKAGFAEADISPNRDATLMGYGFRNNGNDGVHDPLKIRALVVQQGQTQLVLVTLDIALVTDEFANSLRDELAAAYTQTNRACVIVNATHTHSGPVPYAEREESFLRRILEKTHLAKPPAGYLDNIRPVVVDTVKRAAGLLFPVEALVQEAPLGMAYNRRVSMPNGKTANCWGPQEWPERRPGLAPDPTCTVLMFRQKNGPRKYILWNIGAHPVVLGKTSRMVSADYPGVANRLIEEYLPDSRAIFALGAAGNTQPWIATQEDTDQLQVVGRAAASFVTLLTAAARPVADSVPVKLAAVTKSVKHGKHDIALVAWRIGDTRIVTVPVELFNELGLEIRKRLHAPTIIMTVANGCSGYLPTQAAFAEGGYEIESLKKSGIEAGAGEKLVEEVVALAKSLE